LEDLRSAYREEFAKDRSRETLEILVDYLIGSPITSITQAQEALNIGSFNMIQRNIEKLEALGIVREVTGNKRNRIYHAEEILKVLEERL
jgi:predicted transcriptional regulator